MTLSEAEVKQVRDALGKAKNVALKGAGDDCQCGADEDSEHAVQECWWHEVLRHTSDALALLDAKPADGLDAVRAFAQILVDNENEPSAVEMAGRFRNLRQALATPQAPAKEGA